MVRTLPPAVMTVLPDSCQKKESRWETEDKTCGNPACGAMMFGVRKSQKYCSQRCCNVELKRREREARGVVTNIILPKAELPKMPLNQARKAPSRCAYCPLLGTKGVRSCQHPRIGVQWMGRPAIEAKIHGDCPWGRSLQGSKP